MKKINIKTFALSTLFLGALACTDLNQPSPGTLDPNKFFSSDADAIQASIAIYDRLSNDYYTAWTSPYMVHMMPSDESNAGGNNNGDQVGYQNLDDFTVDAVNDKITGTWQLYYSVIQRSNAVVDNVNDSTGTSPLQTRIAAEARTLRALAYFELVNLWGDVPFVIHTVDPTKYGSVGRAKKEVIYAQIEKDLNRAIPNLPLRSEYASTELFRVAKGTAQALLGKVLMYESAPVANGGLGVDKWAAAATVLNDVISSNEYALESGLGRVFSKAGEFGKESLLETSFSDKNYNWGNFPWGGAPEANIHVQLMGPRGDYFTPAPGDSLIGGWGFNLARNLVYDAMEAGDGRKGQTIMSLAEFTAEGGVWKGETSWDFAGYFQRKYSSFVNESNSANGNTTELNYGTNFRLIRYADVLLLAAEAYHNSTPANDAKAVSLVNQVRQRKGTNLTALGALTGTAMMDAIVHERLIELAFEGHRYQDLIRWGLDVEKLGPLGYKKEKHSLFPIPNADVLSANLEQNPGY